MHPQSLAPPKAVRRPKRQCSAPTSALLYYAPIGCWRQAGVLIGILMIGVPGAAKASLFRVPQAASRLGGHAVIVPIPKIFERPLDSVVRFDGKGPELASQHLRVARDQLSRDILRSFLGGLCGGALIVLWLWILVWGKRPHQNSRADQADEQERPIWPARKHGVGVGQVRGAVSRILQAENPNAR